jgi:hypothetical protein
MRRSEEIANLMSDWVLASLISNNVNQKVLEVSINIYSLESS